MCGRLVVEDERFVIDGGGDIGKIWMIFWGRERCGREAVW